MESQFPIEEALVALDRISYKKKYHFRVSYTSRRIEHSLKFADFVAAAGRKLDKFVLKKYKNFKLFVHYPPEDHMDAVFCISQKKQNIYKQK